MNPDQPGFQKTALVTGSGRGLGRGFAERLAALGYSVGVHGLFEDEPVEYGEGTTVSDTATEIGDKYRVRTLDCVGDLTIAANVSRIVEEVSSTLGPIDFLVHNAGGDIAAAGGKPDPNDAVMIKEVDVRAVLERNLLSTIFVCQEVARGMMDRRSGRIVTIGSQAAFGSRPDHVIYTTSKAGVIAYSRCLATQLRPFGINVNCLAPGDTRTGRFLGTREVDEKRLVTEGTLDRIATIDEITRVIEFFAGPMGDFVSGQVLQVNGGYLV